MVVLTFQELAHLPSHRGADQHIRFETEFLLTESDS